MKEFYETYKVYLTRKNLEIAALVVIVLICFDGFPFSHSRSGCLDLG